MGKYNGMYHDLHLHTKASDGFLDIKFLKKFLKEKKSFDIYNRS